MDNLWLTLGLALLPALGNFCGGLLAELSRTTPRRLNLALHGASGLVIAIVAVEIMPRVLESLSAWAIAASFALGGVAYIGIEQLVDRLQKPEQGAASGRTAMWMIYIAVSIDLFSDGLLIGAGSAVATSVALILAAGQVLADFPEGYATIADMKSKGVSRSKRLLLSASFVVPVLLAASLAYFLLRNQPEFFKLAALTFTAGLLMVAAVEEMLSEAHESKEDTRSSILAFVGGFVLFVLVSAGLEAWMTPS
ncbi:MULTISPECIES: ZIP family metal transporter [Chromohalobacter]|uniref:Peptidoglycan-binding protein n=1 Tax=Chromohalobacter canadensis TaxID=141389 RepID=A0ABZ0Y868_9GAMM|nr:MULTISPECIES: ZIP family metal transporter [Chromohalobacter]MCK0768466.1 peptidoglycan-binding protein [Chromohalobacter canadensis]MDV6319345.1 peptidoglycan-binding protein [Chromohalobacter sp. HP20-39]WQH08249.1 peptidoglycan-binding protein [Chromohalobacter canadensis]